MSRMPEKKLDEFVPQLIARFGYERVLQSIKYDMDWHGTDRGEHGGLVWGREREAWEAARRAAERLITLVREAEATHTPPPHKQRCRYCHHFSEGDCFLKNIAVRTTEDTKACPHFLEEL